MASVWTFEGWVYTDPQGKQVGPVSTDDLKKAIASGQLQHTDRVWTKWKGRNEVLLPTLARRAYDPSPPTPPS
jgi:hypothetical protein